jgi:hypothetical protein
MTHRKIVLLALIAAFLLPVLAWPAVAEDDPKAEPEKGKPEGEKEKKPEKPEGPEMDDLSKKTFIAYEKLLHQPWAAGAKKASVTVKAKIENPMMGAQEAKGSYKWDGEKGSLTWDKAQVGTMLDQRGIGKALLDGDFDQDAWKAEFKGGKFTAKKKDDGTILVTVTGETEAGVKSFLFGTDGLAKQMVISIDAGMGAKQDITMDVKYQKEGDKHLQTGESFELEMGGMGKMSVKRETTFEKVKDIWLRKKLVSTTTMGERAMGGMTVEFTDWKLNDDVK